MAADQAEHLIFRARLVERMRDQARGLALLPRGSAREELRGAGRPARARGGRRVRTVAEGISIASSTARRGASGACAVDLAARARTYPQPGADCPVILSVGRLHRVKGFPTLVEAWAGDPELRDAFNLVIVGGDLEHPTARGAARPGRAVRCAGRHPAAAGSLLLLGHRAHRDVIALMAAARAGVPGAVGPGGVYACASEKEEFGLALLEAMASGLSVVGPALGGPPTFIEDGVNGVIADTANVEGAARRAAPRRGRAPGPRPREPGRRDRARALHDRRDGDRSRRPLRPGMTTLLVSPDYASHYFGLAALGRERLRRGGRVVVATGPTLRERVLADGFEHAELRLGAGHNDGVAGAGGQSEAEREHLRAFFDATRQGMTATVAYQVKARGRDMLWRAGAGHPATRRDPRPRPPAAHRRRPARLRGDARAARARAAVRLVPAEPSLPAAAPRAPGRLPGALPERADAAAAGR